MDSVDYSKHLVRIGGDIMRVAEGVDAAADGDLAGDARAVAITKARAKLADYDAVEAELARTSKVLHGQLVKRFAHDVGTIRAALARVDAGGNASG